MQTLQQIRKFNNLTKIILNIDKQITKGLRVSKTFYHNVQLFGWITSIIFLFLLLFSLKLMSPPRIVKFRRNKASLNSSKFPGLIRLIKISITFETWIANPDRGMSTYEMRLTTNLGFKTWIMQIDTGRYNINKKSRPNIMSSIWAVGPISTILCLPNTYKMGVWYAYICKLDKIMDSSVFSLNKWLNGPNATVWQH